MPDGHDPLPPSSLASALADRYRLLREIGAGGMATVYLAEDLKHQRKVALKVLRPELSATLGSERFVREITVAANLQHPHVLPLYDSGEAAGFLFYVMPFVDGMSLREKLTRDGELPITQAARLLRDVADALAYAHAQGVVHRDIKPENVMLSGRHALVTDFGVAKAVTEATGRHNLTTAGVALGTPTYMAPEQATADPQMDHRADIYAFGVMAFELLTGQPPFQRATPQALLAAHVTETPPSIVERRATIPPALAQMVMRCLAKLPADRPQSAEDLVHMLETLATPSGGVTPTDTRPVAAMALPRGSASNRRWIALGGALALVALALVYLVRRVPSAAVDVREPVVVMPFEVQSEDRSAQALSVQVADRMAAALEQASIGKIGAYRPSTAGTDAANTPEQAAKATGAGTLVTGAISVSGGRIELRARVVRARDAATVWALGPFSAPAGTADSAIGVLQDRVVGAVAAHLSPEWAEVNESIYEPPSTLAKFRAMQEARQLYHADRPRKAFDVLAAAFATDTTWLGGKVWLAKLAATPRVLRWGLADTLDAYLLARRARMSRGDALMFDRERAKFLSPEVEYVASRAWFEADSSKVYYAMSSAVQARRLHEALQLHRLRDTTKLWGRSFLEWDAQAAVMFHGLGQFDDELALVRSARTRNPSSVTLAVNETRPLAALGRTEELDRLITAGHALELPGASVMLMATAMMESQLHGHAASARRYAEQTIDGVHALPDSVQRLVEFRNALRSALRTLGRPADVIREYGVEEKRAGPLGLGSAILAMRDRVLAGDTTGALALVARARAISQQEARASSWGNNAAPYYYASQVLALLGRKEEAVAMLRESLNAGWRVGPDERLQWFWTSIKDYPAFVELVRIRD